ncbi:MAG: hypoxanthine phosphoribosyltransferase [Desulfovibrio sp.]|jgi:hypoxanthine phosphoribosyltransferase|nr:hypoxanthine phosphoribosyltransferase [Desulfovibrio sp.]
MNIKIKRVLFSQRSIALRVRNIAEEIDAMYAGEPLVMICVLKGAFMFFSDLMKKITIRPEIDFVRVAGYGASTCPSGTIRFTKDVEIPLAGKHVLLVEDIVDSGRAMDFLMRKMADRGAKSLRLAALIDKRERREEDVRVDFSGFTLASGFVVGYGLDCAEQFRNLPAVHLAVVEQ